MMRRIAFAGIALVGLAAGAIAQEGPCLFDLLKRPAYKQAWNEMLKGAPAPQWLSAFGRGGNGVASPSTTVRIDGQSYEVSNVCKPHDCGDNQFYILFTRGGGQAWGLLQEAGKPPRFYGNPTAGQRAALIKAQSE